MTLKYPSHFGQWNKINFRSFFRARSSLRTDSVISSSGMYSAGLNTFATVSMMFGFFLISGGVNVLSPNGIFFFSAIIEPSDPFATVDGGTSGKTVPHCQHLLAKCSHWLPHLSQVLKARCWPARGSYSCSSPSTFALLSPAGRFDPTKTYPQFQQGRPGTSSTSALQFGQVVNFING